jgi:hypothetical protein
MITIIDSAINSITYAAIGGFVIGFVHYCWQRAANKSAATKFWATVDRKFWQTNLAPRQPEPDLSDEALIRWAKQMQFPGSGKWGFNRRLSQKVRSELLGLMEM